LLSIRQALSELLFFHTQNIVQTVKLKVTHFKIKDTKDK